MTALLTLIAHTRIGRLAIIAAALVICIFAFGASENGLFTFLVIMFGLIFGVSAVAGAVMQPSANPTAHFQPNDRPASPSRERGGSF